MKKENEVRLWFDWNVNKDIEARNKIITIYYHQTRIIAYRIMKQINNNHWWRDVELDDLISYGSFGLIKAVNTFNKDSEAKFTTYLNKCIKWAIYDGLRKNQWGGRTVIIHNNKINKKIDQIYNEENIIPSRTRILNELNFNKNKYDLICLMKSAFIRLDSKLYHHHNNNNEEKNMFYLDLLSTSEEQDPAFITEYRENKRKIKEALSKLSEKEKTVISLRFYNELKLIEIAKLLDCSESNISILLNKVIFKKLRVLIDT